MTIKMGDHVRIKGVCNCFEIVRPTHSSAVGFQRPSGCWHGPRTMVLRIFQDGGLLLEDSRGFVRVAQTNEVRL